MTSLLLSLGALCAACSIVTAAIYPIDICALPVDQGPCDLNYPMFYYDQTFGRCNEFVYRGCAGNPNRFDTLQDCENSCVYPQENVCNLPMDIGTCTDNNDAAKYYYNPGSANCELFLWSGCDGNANRFSTEADCRMKCLPLETDRCELDADSGTCGDAYERFYYDRYAKECRPFTWTGCGGNSNRFAKVEDCANSCVQKTPIQLICEMTVIAGECDGYYTRFYYDLDDGSCKGFAYGGCGGNSNRFITRGACERSCEPDDVCKLPYAEGPCEGDSDMYYFNWNSGQCETFSYSGCEGNGNRFSTEEACAERCLEPQEQGKCLLPVISGPCKDTLTRYYYDQDNGVCREFHWGGCGGNDNRFLTQIACDVECTGAEASGSNSVSSTNSAVIIALVSVLIALW